MNNPLHLKYRQRALIRDYLLALVGLCGTAAPPVLRDFSSVVDAAFLIIAAIFLSFLVRTIIRQFAFVTVTDTEIRQSGLFPRTIAWAKLDRIKLSYYSMRRRRSQTDQLARGWMELQLGSSWRRILLDSSLEGFDEVVERVADVARTNKCRLNEVTRANFAALGFDVSWHIDEQDGRS